MADAVQKKPFRLPPSLQRERFPVEAEVERARHLSPEERLRLLASLCEDAEWLLSANDRRALVVNRRDPLPAGTVALWARLHQRFLHETFST